MSVTYLLLIQPSFTKIFCLIPSATLEIPAFSPPPHSRFPVKVTGTKSGKKVSKNLAANITVKDPATRIKVDGKTVKKLPVVVGSKTPLTAVSAPKSSPVTFKSSNETIATVDADGTLTALKEGTVNIAATNSLGAKSKYVIKVTIRNYALQSVAQTKATELQAVIAGNTKDIKPTDIRIVNADTKVVYPVSKVIFDANDTTKATLRLFSDLNDGKNYDVTLDGVTKSFRATDGVVTDISVNPITVPYATETEIALIAKDPNGVILKELPYGTVDNNYDFSINLNGNGYTNGSKLYLNKIGDTATAEITYKTGKYDQNGKPEGNIGPNKVTITATAQSEISNFDVRIDAATAGSYDKAKDNKKIAVGETERTTAYFMIKNTEGKEISDYSKYTVETSDKTVLMIASGNITSKKTTLTAIKAGTAYILIRDTNGAIVSSVAVDVVAERAAATLELDKYSVVVSKSLTGDSKTVKATVKDQYGDNLVLTADLSVECLSAPAGTATNATAGFYSIAKHNEITFNNTAAKGSYVYKISYKKDGKEVVAKTVSVEIKEASSTTATSWRLDVVNDGVDIKVDELNKVSQDIVVTMVGMNDGIDVSKETGVSFMVKTADGRVIYNDIASSTIVTNSAIVVSGGALNIQALTVSGSKAVKNLMAGSYIVTATKNVGDQVVTITTNFNVKDSQAKPTVEVKENSVSATSIATALQNTLIVRYGDKTYTNRTDVGSARSLSIVEVKGKLNNGDDIEKDMLVASGNYFTVSKLVVTINVATGITMDVEVAVPGVITIK